MFDDLVDDVLRETARHDPAWASREGLSAFDHEVADPGPDALADRRARLEAWLERLAEERDADPVDREALRFRFELEHFTLTRLRPHERNPDLVKPLMDHLLPILMRPGMAADARAAALAARLEKAPAFLESGRARVTPTEVPLLWADVARETTTHAPAFLDAVTGAASDASAPLRARLANAVSGARDALDAHARWLEREVAPVAGGEWAIGEDAFNDLLALRGFEEDTDALWETGHALVDRFRDETREAANTVLAEAGRAPNEEPVLDAWDVIAERHPSSFADVLAAYRTAVEDARAFVRARGLATLTDVPLDIVETPPYLRHLVPFAMYVAPGRFDETPRGTYFVTPKMDLGRFPLAEVRNVTVHEAYPGHHLQLSRAREVPQVARFLVGSYAPETIEGWALYCESMMGRHGFTATPAERFVRARDALWRAMRVVLDVGLHTGRIGFETAARRLSRETGMTAPEAMAEVKRYTLTPGYNLSYMLGRVEFERLRSERERAPGWDERAFHDAILAHGSLPLPLLLKAASYTGVHPPARRK